MRAVSPGAQNSVNFINCVSVWFLDGCALFEDKSTQILQNFFQKSLEIKKKALPLHSQFETGSSPKEWDTTSSLKRLDFYTVQEASTEKY